MEKKTERFFVIHELTNGRARIVEVNREWQYGDLFPEPTDKDAWFASAKEASQALAAQISGIHDDDDGASSDRDTTKT